MIEVKIGSEDCVEVSSIIYSLWQWSKSQIKGPINPLQSPNVSLDWQEPENIPYFRYNSLFYLLSPAWGWCN